MVFAVVDDDEEGIRSLCACLEKYAAETNTSISIKKYRTGVDFISEYAGEFDCVFMDIKMPFMNGIEAAKELRKIDSNVALVFVTSMGQLAIRGYEVEAFDFLVKPVEYAEFKKKADKLIARLKSRRLKTLCVKTSKAINIIDLDEVSYIEVSGRNVLIKTRTGKIEMYESMKSLEQRLIKDGFVRCDNSYLVNLAHVTSLNKNTAVVGGENIPISRSRRKQFVDALTVYFGDHING